MGSKKVVANLKIAIVRVKNVGKKPPGQDPAVIQDIIEGQK